MPHGKCFFPITSFRNFQLTPAKLVGQLQPYVMFTHLHIPSRVFIDIDGLHTATHVLSIHKD